MKTWKKVLLETGIFTAVFALGAGTGFLSFYHKAEEQLPTIKNDASENNPPVREETPTDKYLNNLVATKALEGDVHLTISTKGNPGRKGFRPKYRERFRSSVRRSAPGAQ